MSIWQKKNRILITCPKGVVPYLKAEIEELGFPILQEIDTAVSTEGTLSDTMVLNLHLRTAQHVLYQLQIFKAISAGAFYERLNAIPWETFLHDSGPSAYLSVTSVVDHPEITVRLTKLVRRREIGKASHAKNRNKQTTPRVP